MPREKPVQTDIKVNDRLFIKMVHVPEANTKLEQHVHEYDHFSLITNGRVNAYADGKPLGLFEAPCSIEIKAGVKHCFVTLVPYTTIWCIHNVSEDGEVKFKE